jgi:uncharacterized membrane protein
MKLMRALRHLFTDQWSVRRAFPAPAMRAIRNTIGEQESRHGGELRFAVEASLPLPNLWRGQNARSRAIELFGQLRVWDTEHNNGVLIYLLLADKRVEIIADRGIDGRVGAVNWDGICRGMQQAFANGNFENGVQTGVVAISDLLASHYPPAAARPNELPNEPVVL